LFSLFFQELFHFFGLLIVMKPRIADSFPRTLFVLSLFLANLHRANGSVFWDESINGDLSNNQSAPTSFALQVGVNTLSGTAGSNAGDNQDWLHLTIPSGFSLSAVTPTSFVSSDTTAFTGVQAGSSFVGDPETASPYLGYTHLSAAVVGFNVLPSMGTGPGAIGFTPPLPAGDYVFLIQQLGNSLSYSIDYTVIPEPGSQTVIGALLGGLNFFLKVRARITSGRSR